MKQILIIISLCLVLISCGFTPKENGTNCNLTRDLKIGQVVVALPSCYTLHYPDSLDPNHMYLIKDDSVKLKMSTDGLASLEAFEDIQNEISTNLSIQRDTINNNLRVIYQVKENNKYNLSINIIELERQDTVLSDLDVRIRHLPNEHRHYVKLLAETPWDSGLSKSEIELLTKAFKNSKMTID